jgi:hypothetical protein
MCRAFSSEVDTGSREENASKQEIEPFRFNRNGKGLESHGVRQLLANALYVVLGDTVTSARKPEIGGRPAAVAAPERRGKTRWTRRFWVSMSDQPPERRCGAGRLWSIGNDSLGTSARRRLQYALA